MKARKLIEDAAYPPEVLAVACEAFDQAWHKIEFGFVSDGDREAARMRLAGIILMLARDSHQQFRGVEGCCCARFLS